MDTLLKAQHLTVEFGKLTALQDVSLEMRGGDLLGLIGPNGAGKTTLLRCLAGLQLPLPGYVEVMGMDVFGQDEAVRSHIGFAPDSPPAYEELTIEDFLLFIANAHNLRGTLAQERVDFWIEQVWLEEKRKEQIKNLSRGMKQRITIAQVLVPNPTVVLLDEPSSGLDPGGRIQLRQIIASLANQGKAVIVSSHILADLEEYCNHIAIIEHGRILRSGSVYELKKPKGHSCFYRLTLADGSDPSLLLREINGIANLQASNGGYLFEFADDPLLAAELLRDLIGRKLLVNSFTRQQESLEDLYLRTGVKQVD
ncbi:MAG: putative ABC transporter ATP-binding protein YxlF [Phycisphaerae bacterium]|nr:putative ABC transporter ATP-binding protein YxlF [Phycisphaerae bacterium]